jgi:hypothetical protein
MTAAASVSLLVAAALMTVMRIPHAPVLAMAIVPEVSGPPHSWTSLIEGAFGVLAAIGVLYVVGPLAISLAHRAAALLRVRRSHARPRERLVSADRHQVTRGAVP